MNTSKVTGWAGMAVAVLATITAFALLSRAERENVARDEGTKKGSAMTESESKRAVRKSDDDWRKQLTDKQYWVTRQKGTERPYTGEYYRHSEAGIYTCVCCNADLFASDTKFDAGCGWPSFWHALDKRNVEERRDTSHGMSRTEILCKQCGAHLGHVFNDGPAPTGLRYCINSASLSFKAAEAKKKPPQ